MYIGIVDYKTVPEKAILIGKVSKKKLKRPWTLDSYIEDLLVHRFGMPIQVQVHLIKRNEDFLPYQAGGYASKEPGKDIRELQHFGDIIFSRTEDFDNLTIEDFIKNRKV